jgi:hypothetical protein
VDVHLLLDGLYGDLFDAVDRSALSPEARAAARADPAFRQTDDEWQAFMDALRARRAQRGMLPMMPPAQPSPVPSVNSAPLPKRGIPNYPPPAIGGIRG